MSSTLDLINSSMRLIGVLASGEILPANDANDALSALNTMIDTWSTESLLIYNLVEDDLTLIAGQQSYTMGTGGNFNTMRSQKIENALIRKTNGSTTTDLPMEIVNQDQWAAISVKAATSAIPLKLYQENTYPLDTILLWPIPSAANTLVLWSWKPLSSFASLSTVISLPPGYMKAMKYNLAVELAPEYGKSLDPVVLVEAAESKAAVKRMNTKPQYLSTDAALLSQRSVFNWLTGE